MSSQVKKKAAEIDALIAANAAAARGEEVVPPAEQAESVDEGQPPAEQPVLQVVSQPIPAVDTPPTSPLEAQLAQARAQAEAAEQRWKSLDGQLRSRDQQIDRLTELVTKMAPAAEAAAPVIVGVQSEDADAFGDDMIDFVQRVARQAAQNEIAKIQGTLQGLTQEVQTVAKHTAKSLVTEFEDGLDTQSPRWREFDTAPEFHAWLAQSPARHNVFVAGCESKDAAAVAEIFNMYVVVSGKAQVTPPPNPNVSKLEMQVSPGKSRSTAVPSASAPTGERIWTRSEIVAAYKRKQKGGFSKDEWTALEREIESAQKNERVDYSR